MNFVNVQSISYLKDHTCEIVKQVTETQIPLAISVNGKVQVVIQDAVSFEKTQEQLAMLSLLALGSREIAEGKVIDADDFFARLEPEDNESQS